MDQEVWRPRLVSDEQDLNVDNLETLLKEQKLAATTSHHELVEQHVSDQYKGLRVLGMLADNTACGFYRVINPLTMLKQHGAEVTITSAHNYRDFQKADVILIPRQHSSDIYELVCEINWDNKLTIFEIDDNLDFVLPTSPAYTVYHQGAEALKVMPRIMANCLGLTTTTPEIAKWYHQYNQNTYIVKNYVDFSLRNWGTDVRWVSGQPVFDLKPIPRPPEWADKIVLAYSGGSCFDDQTEILTDQGWRFFKDLDKTELVASLNRATREVEYQKPTEYFEIPFDGALIHVDNQYVNYASTPNHWHYIARTKNPSKKGTKYELLQAEKLTNSYYALDRRFNWVPGQSEQLEFRLPGVAKNELLDGSRKTRVEVSDQSIPMNEWLEFFGYWLSEGYTAHGANLVHVGVTQTKSSHMLSRCEELLTKWGLSPVYTRRNTEIRVCQQPLWAYLHQFGKSYEKYIPRELLELSPEQLEILYRAFLAGDGGVEQNGRIRLYTSSARLANDLSELVTKLGYCATITNRGIRGGGKISDGRVVTPKHNAYVINVVRNNPKSSKTNRPSVKPEDHTNLPYNGNVYCVTVPNHIIYVRRQGKPMWAGNTHQTDLLQIGPAVRRTLDHYPQVVFAFYGSVEMCLEFIQRNNLPKDRVYRVPARHFLDFPQGLFGFDIGLATIEPCEFNASKSSLKICEYLATEIVPIATNFVPYARFAQEHPGRALTVGQGPNSYRNWESAIAYLVENPEVLQRMKREGREFIVENYALERNFHRWPMAWAAIANDCRTGRFGPPVVEESKEFFRSSSNLGRNDPCPCGSGKKAKKCCGVLTWSG